MNRFALSLGVFLLIIIVIILVFFRGGSDDKKATPKALNEYSYDSSSEVSFTTRGAINGDDKHRSIRIIVARDYRRIDVVQGYEGNVIKTQQFVNNSEAYREFLYAIDRAGFLNEKKIDEKQDIQAGRCSTGSLFIYEHNVGTEEISESWNATCKDMGTFVGNTTLVRSLFQAQITDYSQITSGVSLSL